MASQLAPRLRRLPHVRVLGRDVPVAVNRLARLLGLAFLPRELAGNGLLIPYCRSVHTLGMRFPLRIIFLDETEAAISTRPFVQPGRFVREPRAAGVLELPA